MESRNRLVSPTVKFDGWEEQMDQITTKEILLPSGVERIG
jgi:hypothetical protein